MGWSIKVQLTGLEEALAKMRGLSKTRTGRILRKAMSHATKKALKLAKSFLVPVERTGQLRKSMGRKVKTMPDGRTIGLIGPRKGFKIQVGVWSKGKYEGKPKYVNPIRYAHLVEYGTVHSAPHSFLRKAWDQIEGPIQAEMAGIIEAELLKQGGGSAGGDGGVAGE